MVNPRLTRQVLATLWTLWNLSTFDGQPSQDAQTWLRRLEQGAQTLGIPNSQLIPTALHFLEGEVQTIMRGTTVYLITNNPTLPCNQRWTEFKNALIDVHNRRVQGDTYQKIVGGGFMIAGSTVVLPSLGILAINAVGFTAGGVAAGSLAAAIQSVVYGGATGGIFSLFQSIGATAVVAPPFALALGVAGIVGGAYHLANRGGRDDNDPGTGGSPNAPGGGGAVNVDLDEYFYKECKCTDCLGEAPPPY